MEDQALAKRSIGVISLIGDHQAKLIYDRLVTELGAEVMERHRIMCGNAANFQGQERDVVFLSMVACPATAAKQTSRIFEQRFNVAMSRARDRLVLVRSVTSSMLKPGDLKLAVIDHFDNPMGGAPIAQKTEILDRCESGFERDFGRRLLDLGYRIRPQVSVGERRIDFVIEGAQDRRLAVELDGDDFHGPDRWPDDLRRQKALERIGWTFWRCWGSNWVVDPEGCLADLKGVLKRMAIEPLGAAPTQDVWTEHRVVESSAEPGPEVKPESEAKVPEGADIRRAAVPLTDALKPRAAPASPPAAPQRTKRPTSSPDLFAGLSGKSAPAGGLFDRLARTDQDRPAARATPAPAAPSVPAVGVGAEVAKEGDLVIVRYNDEPNRQIRVRLTRQPNRPAEGMLNINEPLAKAIIGNGVDDEIDVEIGGGRTRTAVIERIEPAPS
jgi:very-short-patch-repair endonuclease